MSKKIILIALMFYCLSSYSYAQKLGYVDTQALLTDMADVKIADTKLEAYQNELISKGKEMVIIFENEYKAYSKEVNQGTLSKIQMQSREEALNQKREEIQNFEVEMQSLLEQKRQELFEPIIQKIKNEINKLGQEEGYFMIFDQSAGFLLHADTTENLMPLLKTKLGIN